MSSRGDAGRLSPGTMRRVYASTSERSRLGEVSASASVSASTSTTTPATFSRTSSREAGAAKSQTTGNNPANSGHVVSPLTQSNDILDALNAAVGGRSGKSNSAKSHEERFARFLARESGNSSGVTLKRTTTPQSQSQSRNQAQTRPRHQPQTHRMPSKVSFNTPTPSILQNPSPGAGLSVAVTTSNNPPSRNVEKDNPCILTYGSLVVLRSVQGTCLRANKLLLDASGSASEESCAIVPVNAHRRADEGPVRSGDSIALSCAGCGGRFLGVWSRKGPYMESETIPGSQDNNGSDYVLMARRKQFGRNEKWTVVSAADADALHKPLTASDSASKTALVSSQQLVLRSELVPRLFLCARVVGDELTSGGVVRLELSEYTNVSAVGRATWSMVKSPAPYVPDWSRARSFLTGDYMVSGREALDAQKDAAAENRNGGRRVSLAEQETLLVDELLYAMQGIGSTSITFCTGATMWKSNLGQMPGALWDIGVHVGTGQVFVDTDSTLGASGVADPSLLHLARRMLPLCVHYVRVSAFVEARSKHEHGKTAHALAAAVRKLLGEFDVLVAQLEEQHRAGFLSMQKLWFYVQPSMRTLEILDFVATECRTQRGGHLLNQLRNITQRGGDAKTLAVFDFLMQRAVVPYLEMLELWIYHGHCHDPYEEFVVKIDAETEKQMLGEDFNANYWDKKYTIRPAAEATSSPLDALHNGATVQTPARSRGTAGEPVRKSSDRPASSNDTSKHTDNENVPFFLKRVANKVLTTGKYLNVARECGKWVAAPFARRLAYVASDAEHGFDAMVTEAYRWASEMLLKLLLEENQLVERLRSIKHYFLMDQGDFFVHFMDVAGSKLLQKADDIALPRLQAILEMCLRSRYANDPFQDDLTCDLVPYTLIQHVDAIHETAASGKPASPVTGMPSPGMSVISPGAPGTASTNLVGTDAFTLDIRVRYPLSIVLSRQALTKYQLIFRHLFFCKHVERQLCSTWLSHQATKELDLRSTLGPDYCLRQRMLHFLQNFEYYMMFEVLEPRWHEFESRLRNVRSVDDLMRYHSEFLDTCLRECLLTHQSLLKQLAKLMTTCLLFAEQVERFADSIHVDEESMKAAAIAPTSIKLKLADRASKERTANMELRRTRRRVQSEHIRRVVSQPSYRNMITRSQRTFDKILRTFMTSLMSKAAQGEFHSHLSNLCTRLDYNSYYTP